MVRSPLLLVVTLLLSTRPAAAQETGASDRVPEPATTDGGSRPRRRALVRGFHLGPEFTVFLPTDRAVRDRFGGTWGGIGIGLGELQNVASGESLGFSFALLTNAQGSSFSSGGRDGEKALLVPLYLRYRISPIESPLPNRPAPSVRPYGEIRLGGAAVDLQTRRDDFKRGADFVGNLGLAAGVQIRRHWYGEANYQWFTKTRGFDLSGAGLTVGYRF